MTYTVAVKTTQMVEIEAENGQEAIQKVKSQLDPRVAAAASFSIAIDAIYNEEKKCYEIPKENDEKGEHE